jgi:cytochrome c biogenesis protein CcmG/thiol:disulfide interchange protein DsbE
VQKPLTDTDQDPLEAPEASPKRDWSTHLFVAVGLVFLALFANGLMSSREGGRLQQGESAPDFELTLLDGSSLRLSDLRGQTVVLNFWASWCAPCRREASDLQSVWEAYQDQDVVFVGVTYHDAKDASLAFVQEYGITYANGVDEMGRISDAYGVTAVPETYLIDREGQLSWYQIGEVQADVLIRQLDLAAE